MQKLIYLSAMLLAIALPSVAQTPVSTPTACALKASEISAALGVKFEEGQPGTERSAGAIVMRNCRYKSKEYSVDLNTVTYATAADAKATSKMLAGKLVPVANDPDGAASQEEQGDLTSPNLHYFRGATAVELRVLGTFYKDIKNKEADARALQVKMQKLRRVP
jgi:hypothetical protein